jgi:hypothetical protein
MKLLKRYIMKNDVRESYTIFPTWSQPLWTWMTGKPSAEENPLIVLSSWVYLAVSLSLFLIGVLGGISVLAFAIAPIWTLAFLIPLAVYGARLLILTIAHQCAHLMFCHSKSLNQIVHDILTTLVCSQDYDSYRYDHFHVHHGIKTFGTFEDPVLSFIKSHGFTGELSKRQLWLRLVWTCVSPRFHTLYLFNRVRFNLFGGRVLRRILAVCWWTSIIVFLSVQPQFIIPVLVGYILPIAFFYNISAFMELICEHVWMRPIGDARGRERITELSWGRFCGEAVPENGGLIPWFAWILRTIFYHLPCRLLVLTGDAPQHDFHHVSPNNRRWTVSAYERREAVISGKMEDREIWGLLKAIDIVFENISTVSEHTKDVAYLNTSPPNPRKMMPNSNNEQKA